MVHHFQQVAVELDFCALQFEQFAWRKNLFEALQVFYVQLVAFQTRIGYSVYDFFVFLVGGVGFFPSGGFLPGFVVYCFLSILQFKKEREEFGRLLLGQFGFFFQVGLLLGSELFFRESRFLVLCLCAQGKA